MVRDHPSLMLTIGADCWQRLLVFWSFPGRTGQKERGSEITDMKKLIVAVVGSFPIPFVAAFLVHGALATRFAERATQVFRSVGKRRGTNMGRASDVCNASRMAKHCHDSPGTGVPGTL